MPKQPMSDVVVLIPGILGSVLARDGKDVWAPTPGAIGRALWSLGGNVRDLELTSDPWEVDDLGDGVTAPRVMPDVHIIPGLWGIDGYSGISRMITERFDAVPGETYLELPYDWRRDNRVAARALRRLADEKLHAARQTNPDAKLVLIGHSMGGLVARYFLECLDGWHDTRMLITFGTPHRGSLNAVDFLVNGFVKKLGPLKLADLTDLLRSLTSVYQLLPTYPCVDLGDGVRARRRCVAPGCRRRQGAYRAGGLPRCHRRRHRCARPGRLRRSTPSSASPRAPSSPPASTATGGVRGDLRRDRPGRRRHGAADVGNSGRDGRLESRVPADVLRRPACRRCRTPIRCRHSSTASSPRSSSTSPARSSVCAWRHPRWSTSVRA